jgi:O-antigen/teichoic acid export membrane protein
LHVVRDFGVLQYLVGEPDLNQRKIAAAFGMAILVAWILAAVVAGLSGPVATFYEEPGVRSVMLVLALSFILIPFGSVTLALLRRNMEFGILARIGIAGGVAHAVTAIYLAWQGFGYMSMAWASLVNVATTALMATLYRPRDMPLWPSFREFRSVASFGTQASVANIANDIGNSVPELIIGKALGFQPVGFYSRAHGLIDLFTKAVLLGVKPVILPHFAQVRRDQGDLCESYCRALHYLTGIGWPFFGFLAVMAFPIIRILYGDQWDAAVPLTQILCIYGVFYTVYWLVDDLYIAVGAVQRYVRYSLGIQVAKIGLVLGAVSFGLEATMTALAVAGGIRFIAAIVAAKALIGLTWRAALGSMTKSALVAMCTVAGPLVIAWSAPDSVDLLGWPFASALGLAAIGWLGGIYLVGHGLAGELTRIVEGVLARYAKDRPT